MSFRSRKISQATGALALLGILSTSVANADPAVLAAAGTTDQATSVAPSAPTDVARTGPLSDVPLNSWAYDAVDQLAKDGIIKGYPDGTFKGNRPMTRYEAAVLAYRAVDELEAQITAGKAVEKADIDAANKLLAAYGTELKAVERHVAALQKQADTTDKDLASTTALGKATAATIRRAQIHVSALWRAVSYGQTISANAGPLPQVFNGVTYGPGQALPAGIGSAPTGTPQTGAYTTPAGVVTAGAGTSGGIAWGNQPMYVMGQNGNTTGTYNHGLGTQYLSLSIGGNPDAHSQYLVKITQLDRYSSVNYYPQETPALCTGATVGTGGAACSTANSGAADADGYLQNFMRLQDMWYQYTTPGGIYAKVGKFVEDEGPKQLPGTSWSLDDYVNGARVGWRNSQFNAQIGYGFEDTAAQQNLLYGLPFSSQVMYGEMDYQLDKKGHTDIGVDYVNYSGFHEVLWDSYAVNCLSTAVPTAAAPRTSKTLPLVNGQAFNPATGCGTGYTPIVYGAPGANAGLPITGAYVTTGAGAFAPHESLFGAFFVGNYGQLRISADGTIKMGNDPTTGSKYTGNTSGLIQADYGPYLQGPGVKGKYSLELGAWAAGFNGLSPTEGYYQSGTPWAQYGTDWSGYYLAFIGVKKFITDTAYVGIWYDHAGLLPNEIIPAGSASCPGCVVSGDSRNAVYGEVNLAF
jgi:hypothetical protein